MPPSSKWLLLAACSNAISGTASAGRAASPIRCTKVSIPLLVAASAFASDSVEGQRSWPSGGTRLGFVEGGGGGPGGLGGPRRGPPGAGGEPIQRGPDLLVGQEPRCFR